MTEVPIRVAFVLRNNGNQWIGGTNYFINLLRAMQSRPKLIPVIVISEPQLPPGFNEFSNIEVLCTDLVAPRSTKRLTRIVIQRIISRDIMLERFLRRNRIDVLSHSGVLGRRSKVPAIDWLPDFQHHHLPEYFNSSELRLRNRAFFYAARDSQAIVLSSHAAEADFYNRYPFAREKSAVLQFASSIAQNLNKLLPRNELEQRYGIKGPYFHLPNQFWIHKNHTIVLDALSLARRDGRNIMVVCTGLTNDYRQPNHFESVVNKVQQLGLSDNFKILGVVSYEALLSLMFHATSIINPSLFEGWSTTVEEAKSIGKRIILSNIDVHIEQAPKHGTFFDPTDARSLCEAMSKHLDSNSIPEEIERIAGAKMEQALRISEFGRSFERIIGETILRKV
jgi:glycosyltransferase involved in cell wall biosynthesis